MSSDPTTLARRVVHESLVYAIVVAVWVYKLRHAGLGSTLEMALVGAVLAAMLGGLRVGAGLLFAADPWVHRRVVIGGVPREFLWQCILEAVLASVIAGVVGACALALWSTFTDVALWSLAQTQGVLLGVFVASVGVGATWSALLKADRMAVAFGFLTWMPVMTAFAWVPSMLPHSSGTLGHAVNASPMMGVMSALDRRDVFWSPLFYGRFPYAEYAVHVHDAGVHMVVWLAVGICLLAANGWWLRRRWLA